MVPVRASAVRLVVGCLLPLGLAVTGCTGASEPGAGSVAGSAPSGPAAGGSPSTTQPEEQAGLGADRSEPTGTTSVLFTGAVLRDPAAERQVVALRIESRVDDVTSGELQHDVLSWLNHPDGWRRAGFVFVSDDASPFLVVLAEGDEVDELCLPLETGGTVSCQNGPVVALNADRWRDGVDHWDSVLADYRGYLVNHEIGHLLGQRHPVPRCPVEGRPAAVMEQQTGSLRGCTGNPWPRDWEIELARQRPVVYAPLPDWVPDPPPSNTER